MSDRDLTPVESAILEEFLSRMGLLDDGRSRLRQILFEQWVSAGLKPELFEPTPKQRKKAA